MLEELSSALLPVDQGKYADDFTTGGTHGVDGASGRGTGGDHVLDDGDAVLCLKRALDELARSVRLGFLPYRERANW